MSDRSDAFAAFADAVDYFHARLDDQIGDHVGECDHPECDGDECSRPTTARGYFEEHREWDAETLDEWKLGYAPGGGGLATHLREQGYSEETMRATGLFTKNLTALWRGRYVLPYFGEDGRPVYAIARTAGSVGGGAAGYDGHPEDFLAGKYAKVAHTKDHVPVEEPIFGLSTLDESKEIVIAEGIADAITASEAGYSVLSPVTTQFKREHFDELLDLVGGGEERAVYVIPDSEQAGFSRIDSDDIPAEPEHIYQAVNIPKVSPGIAGALRTANYLRENSVDARVVELPRAGLRKVDLDDYLHEWHADLDEPLRMAKPPAYHAAFDAATESQTTTTDEADTPAERPAVPAERPDTDSDLSASRADGMSALWGLSLDEVNQTLHKGYRGRNPLAHTGESENYFGVFSPTEDGDLLAMDYKRKVKYNGLTYLLVEEGVRPVGDPEGSLSPSETWEAWRVARERGLLGPDDTVPSAALRHIAEDRGLYGFDALPADADALPAKAHNKALYWLKEEWWNAGDDDEAATSRHYKAKDPEEVRTWEDVRYVYEEDNAPGRHAAEALLRERHDFMTIAEEDTLYVYDPATGTFSDELSGVKAEIHAGLGEFWSTHELNEVEARLRQQPIVKSRHLNGRAAFDDPHVAVENGVLNLFTRELLDHSPEYRFADRVPVTYDPEADTEPYEEVLDDWTGREEDALAMVEMVGHALIPDANERYKHFLMLTGDSNNGKTVFFNRVTDLLEGTDHEESNVSNVKLGKITSNRFATNSIHGHMANIAGEVNGKKIRKTATLKDIPGGEQVELEPKGKDPYFDTINASLMFAANDPPLIGAATRDREAIANRIVPIELPHTFVSHPDESDPSEKEAVDEMELKDRLTTDEAMSGFLNLALDGIERLEANGGDVSIPESPAERLRKYEKNADPMKEFAHECLKNSDSDYLVKDDVTTIFQEFAAATGNETGTNVGSTLHSVLRSVDHLNYSDAYKRSPDYSGTDLPLRGRDERKNVIERVSLTEEGLKHARARGLVVEETDADGEADVPLADLDTGRHSAITATVGGMYEPAPWLSEEGWLDDETVALDYKVRTGRRSESPFAGVSKGDEVVIRNAAVKTDDDGMRYIEVSPKCDVEVVNGASGPGGDGGSSGAQAATDGGHVDDAAAPGDAVGAKADAQDLAKLLSDTGKTKSHIELVELATDRLGADPDRAERLIDYAVSKLGIINGTDEAGYSANYP